MFTKLLQILYAVKLDQLIAHSCRKMPSKGVIIGFAGVTNGGKTTTCRWLKDSLQQQNIHVTHFTMDHYYWAEDSPNHVLLPQFDHKYANWDDVCAVNWERLLGDIAKWKADVGSSTNNIHSAPPVLLVEGIMIYNHQSLLPYFDKKYFFTLPKEECWDRRRNRSYDPPEPEGYFDQIAWPHYLKLKQEISSQNDIVYLDGTRSQQESFKEIKDEVDKLLQGS